MGYTIRNGYILRFEITAALLNTFGTGTLVGTLSGQEGYFKDGLPEELVLIFPETSLRWRETHGGPDSLIVNEYVPKCILDDVLWFISQGVKVNTETLTRDP